MTSYNLPFIIGAILGAISFFYSDLWLDLYLGKERDGGLLYFYKLLGINIFHNKPKILKYFIKFVSVMVFIGCLISVIQLWGVRS